MNNFSKLSLSSVALALLIVAGCESTTAHDATSPALKLEATRSSILVNESATVFAKSENTLGKHASVTWSSSFGKITPEKDGMLDFRSDKPSALFTSDKPGTAVITATLTLDDGQKITDSVNIDVHAIQ